MRDLTNSERETLRLHELWLGDGPCGVRADLRDANLSDADLRDADLRYAILTDADLRYADLRGALLRGAILRGANLTDVDLSGAILRGADLTDADLRDAYLRGTCLSPDARMPRWTRDEAISAGLEIGIVDGRVVVWGYRTAVSRFAGSTKYTPGRWYDANALSVDTSTDCHPGVYLASREWLRAEYPGADLVRCYAYADEVVHAGEKWRARRIFVTEEVE